jgi:hypothetical protein
MPTTLDIDYYLHVDLLVKKQNAAAFEEAVTEFLNKGGFARIVEEGDDRDLKHLDTKRLLLALKAVELEEYRGGITMPSAFKDLGEHPADAFRYIHVWNIPHIRDLDLVSLMRLCAADSIYRRLDALVAEESQDFVVQVKTPIEPSQFEYFIRGMRRFQSFDMGTYIFNVGVLLKHLKESGVLPLGQFQSVTGTINTVIEFWNTQEVDDRSNPDIIAALAKDKSLDPRFIAEFVTPSLNQTIARDYQLFTAYLDRRQLAPAQENGQLDYLESLKG